MLLLNSCLCGLWNSCCLYLTSHNTATCAFSNQMISWPNTLSWGHLYLRMGTEQTASFLPTFIPLWSFKGPMPSATHLPSIPKVLIYHLWSIRLLCRKSHSIPLTTSMSGMYLPTLDFGQRNVRGHDITKSLKSVFSFAPLPS